MSVETLEWVLSVSLIGVTLEDSLLVAMKAYIVQHEVDGEFTMSTSSAVWISILVFSLER